MKLTKSKLKQIIKEQLMYVLNEKKYFKDFATNPRFAPDVRVWIPEHIRKNKDLWRAALQAHQNPSPTPEDTKTIQTLQQSLASFEAGDSGASGDNAAVKGLILFVLEENSYFIDPPMVKESWDEDEYSVGDLVVVEISDDGYDKSIEKINSETEFSPTYGAYTSEKFLAKIIQSAQQQVDEQA